MIPHASFCRGSAFNILTHYLPNKVVEELTLADKLVEHFEELNILYRCSFKHNDELWVISDRNGKPELLSETQLASYFDKFGKQYIPSKYLEEFLENMLDTEYWYELSEYEDDWEQPLELNFAKDEG